MSLIFYDETALNPLPPGIRVSVKDPFGNVVATAYTKFGGVANITVQGATPYIASYYGTQAPLVSSTFVGNAVSGADTTIIVKGYRSPTLSQDGYTQLQTDILWPRDWFNANARSKGGIAYALAYALAAGVSLIDNNTEQLHGALRSQTAVGGDLDSWAFDFFGVYLTRYPGEDNATFLSRLLAAFGPRCTVAAIEQLVVQFYAATLKERILAQATELAYDVTGSYEERGGYDVFVTPQNAQALTPAVKVWDVVTRPDLAATYSIAQPKFVIQIGFNDAASGWFLDHDHLDIETFLIDGNVMQFSNTAPDARLGALVNLVKAAGCQPVYATYTF